MSTGARPHLPAKPQVLSHSGGARTSGNAFNADAAARLHAAVFERGWTAAEFEVLLEDPLIATTAALCPLTRALLGLALVRRIPPEAEVLTVMVDPNHQGKGVGMMIIRAALSASANVGCSRVFLEVGEANRAARALYAKLGFRETARRAGYYVRAGQPPMDALVMEWDAAEQGGPCAA